tara:strand:+ start:513 stop:719 length:207 start_codon:yes stop_codon:yes gene_type:complete
MKALKITLGISDVNARTVTTKNGVKTTCYGKAKQLEPTSKMLQFGFNPNCTYTSFGNFINENNEKIEI